MMDANPLAAAVAQVHTRLPAGRLPIIIVLGSATEVRMWRHLNPVAGRCLRQRVVFPSDLSRVRGTDREAWIVVVMESFLTDDTPAPRRSAVTGELEQMCGPSTPWLYWSLRRRDYQTPSC